MRERPILFSGPMVRAIRDGKKTQTRRVIKPPRWADPSHGIQFIDGWPVFAHRKTGKIRAVKCPYGVPGDRLWVREATRCHNNVMIYSAEYPERCVPVITNDTAPFGVRWKWQREILRSIHMPRWASRINRDITEIRVERLNDISEEDAIAEGCESTAVLTADGKDYTGLYAKEHYAELWEEINGVGSWQKNPLVLVVSFQEVK